MSREDGKETFGFGNKVFGSLLRFVLKCKFEEGLLDKKFELFDGRTMKVDDLVSRVDIINDSNTNHSLRLISNKFIELEFVKDLD